jgi:hypothetical protein
MRIIQLNAVYVDLVGHVKKEQNPPVPPPSNLDFRNSLPLYGCKRIEENLRTVRERRGKFGSSVERVRLFPVAKTLLKGLEIKGTRAPYAARIHGLADDNSSSSASRGARSRRTEGRVHTRTAVRFRAGFKGPVTAASAQRDR